MGEQYICRNCDYKWTSKKSFGSPSVCPHCNSRDIIDYKTWKSRKKALDDEIEFTREQNARGLFKYSGKWLTREEINNIKESKK